MLATITSSFCLLVAGLQPAITCRATVYSQNGDALASPTVKTNEGQRAEIRVGDDHFQVRFAVTPTFWAGGVIHNDIRVRIADHRSHHEPGHDFDQSHSTDCRLTFTVHPEETERVVFGEKGVRYLKHRDEPHLGRGEYELDLTESVG